jgi:hypothetical protein
MPNEQIDSWGRGLRRYLGTTYFAIPFSEYHYDERYK